MKIPISVTCPYCGFVNITTVGIKGTVKPKIILCDSEDGGCDNYFAARHAIIVQSSTFKLTTDSL